MKSSIWSDEKLNLQTLQLLTCKPLILYKFGVVLNPPFSHVNNALKVNFFKDYYLQWNILWLLLLLLLSSFSRVRLCATPETAAHQAPRPWDSPGKNTGVGCHFLLQRMKVKSESEVVQSCLTLCDPMDCSLPGSSIHGIFQARVLEWGAIAFSENII